MSAMKKAGFIQMKLVSTVTATLDTYLLRLFIVCSSNGASQKSTISPEISASNLLEFTLQVIRLFSSSKLLTPGRLGPGCVQRPPEAAYQDEFYRSCHVVSEGAIVTFPKLGNAMGRIEFYILHKKRGIELPRDGSQPNEDFGRFSTPEKYQQVVPTNEYIILDFCLTLPQIKHPGLNNLYHIAVLPMTKFRFLTMT
ncbi:hypothetical protein CPB83DRAFT_652391 [Crepidotus variabilis]|uniref:Uncharacterized protein n=1 Tax=Crepidotus variabilis TaxID=179855 RepID=A0A9P6E783_9AGAR|nr:hypothetical protein CPB83DRAFT_652391 [Crepidotus variabilis]